jgi:hypothetical protein
MHTDENNGKGDFCSLGLVSLNSEVLEPDSAGFFPLNSCLSVSIRGFLLHRYRLKGGLQTQALIRLGFASMEPPLKPQPGPGVYAFSRPNWKGLP